MNWWMAYGIASACVLIGMAIGAEMFHGKGCECGRCEGDL